MLLTHRKKPFNEALPLTGVVMKTKVDMVMLVVVPHLSIRHNHRETN